MPSNCFLYIFLAIEANAVYAASRTHDFGLDVTCPLGYFPCGNITKCLPQLLHCNGIDDCGNQADEDDCGDNSGWSQQLDAIYNIRISQDASEVETDECLVESLPTQCLCRGLELDCDDAGLHTVPSVSSNITMMSLQRNLLGKLVANGFKKYQDLKYLFLQNNNISIVSGNAFRGLYNLTKLYVYPLDLANNKIESLPPLLFKDLKVLSQLNLSYNPIQKIQADQFDYLRKLNSLSLEGIEIKNIQRRMFRPLKDLSHIYFKKFQYCGYAPHVRSCKPNTDGISSFENLLASVIQRVFVWVVSSVTCFGNIFVVCTRPYIRSENKLHALSIMSLCCADCLMGIYLFVIAAFDLKYRGEYNKHAQLWMDSIHCQLVGSLAILSTEVSVLLLTYLTLEKYICIVYPFRFLKPGKYRTISILVLIWIIGFIVAFIPLSNKDFFQNYYGANGVCFPLHSQQSESTGGQIYSVIIFLGVNLVAFIIIVFSYGSMFYSIHQTAITAMEIQNHVKKEMTLAKRFFFIVFTDALCWIPIFILKLLSLLQVEIPGSITSWVVIFILPINSALNPLLYTLTTRPFKEMIHQTWHNYRQRRSSGNKSSQKMYSPSFIWVEMWPAEDTSSELTKPSHYTDSSKGLISTHSARLNVYT
ncbi:relaxin receptor 1 [Varanus komodoensis]|uniref:relaxin receptor 1 n=1 Tax=Varanus komodoensis TaxID=61221 RepID=UPI001CF7D7BB|nr:relaxin receptor 1 [Varanus komodoensis]